MSLHPILPERRPQGSWLFRLLLRGRPLFLLAGPLLGMALFGLGCLGLYQAWLTEAPLYGVGAVLAWLGAGSVAVLCSEYDWWLFKLGPSDSLEWPLE
ncbi:hypothetical protein [Pseudomonas panipatensis]|uniref:Uncharacterized protein n=1 Tax=Pseudomonas panipatensis TaxID=428992 RepID=A0A1G8E393_9PSED|nr:hypothetical protein [Pseudomonas panipatensis]SDH64364.1 hypothetical protein SAMN05216272_102305 [Pseudomonas panipatensis]SMP38726.1 hypothetical protein SAMN06295951_101185 [Pseudomonas panipatensis]